MSIVSFDMNRLDMELIIDTVYCYIWRSLGAYRLPFLWFTWDESIIPRSPDAPIAK